MPTPIIDVPTGLIYQTEDLDHGSALSAVATAYEGSGVLYDLITLSATPGWADLQAKRMAALDATLTGFWWQHLGALDPDVTLATGKAALAVDGGGLRLTNSGGSPNWVYLSRQLLDNATTDHWAIAFRAAFLAPVNPNPSYKLGWVGLGGTDANNYGVCLTEYGQFGGSNTNMCVFINSAAGTTYDATSIAVDAGVYHDWLIQSDAVTLTFQRDGAAIYSTTSFTNVPAAIAGKIVARGNDGHYVDMTDIAFGFVRP